MKNGPGESAGTNRKTPKPLCTDADEFSGGSNFWTHLFTSEPVKSPGHPMTRNFWKCFPIFWQLRCFKTQQIGPDSLEFDVWYARFSSFSCTLVRCFASVWNILFETGTKESPKFGRNWIWIFQNFRFWFVSEVLLTRKERALRQLQILQLGNVQNQTLRRRIYSPNPVSF